MSPKIWGPVVWTLIHSLTYNINTEDRRSIQELYYVINNMISSVPCPTCSKDGIAIMKTIRVNSINTKSDLVNIMIHVHNRVNSKLSKPQFNPIDNDKTYKDVNLVSYLNHYIHIMTKRKYNTNLMHGMGMNRCIKEFISYIMKNKNLFNKIT
jgi:hypothetical protein